MNNPVFLKLIKIIFKTKIKANLVDIWVFLLHNTIV